MIVKIILVIHRIYPIICFKLYAHVIYFGLCINIPSFSLPPLPCLGFIYLLCYSTFSSSNPNILYWRENFFLTSLLLPFYPTQVERFKLYHLFPLYSPWIDFVSSTENYDTQILKNFLNIVLNSSFLKKCFPLNLPQNARIMERGKHNLVYWMQKLEILFLFPFLT